ncbi:hypothetical protein ACJRO7_007122 [Eucalyptus globulus]|uniref:F-box domain-containing protein n=1 Tax=Eucalyptus globulus TaxID=34317 RepID=A0ABD3IMZ2_EUCGL
MSMDELPMALLSDILSRVSSRSLIRHRCICKRWREVVDDFYSRITGKELLCQEIEEGKIYLLDEQEEATKMIQIAKFPGLKDYIFQGACNGLLLFAHKGVVKNNPDLLLNPLTQEILRLPRAPDFQPHKSVYGFGFDRSTNTYKMVQIDEIDLDEETRTCTVRARIYDFEKRSWRICRAPPPPPSSHSARPDGAFVFASRAGCTFVFASGALYWFLYEYSPSGGPLARAMLSFDLTREEFNPIPIPDGLLRDVLHMHELEGSLALVHYPKEAHIDVWVLEDYRRREWTRKHRIRAPCAGG